MTAVHWTRCGLCNVNIAKRGDPEVKAKWRAHASSKKHQETLGVYRPVSAMLDALDDLEREWNDILAEAEE